jgi:hypothetical protein
LIVPESKPEKGWRVATSVGFLSGILACLDAVRDSRAVWPPDALWAALQHPQRMELGGGIALILVTIVITIVRHSQG